MKVALSIAGHDVSGAAGVAADLRVFAAMGVHGCSAVTAVTAQSAGLHLPGPVDVGLLRAQIEALREGLPIDAIKIGLLPTADAVRTVAAELDRGGAGFVVLDPVLAASRGPSLVEPEVILAIRDELFSRVTLVTPNHPELETLLDRPVDSDEESLLRAGEELREWGAPNVLLKGGHREPGASDLLVQSSGHRSFVNERVPGIPARGTGCALSAAIAALAARSRPLEAAVDEAKEFLTVSLQHSYFLGGEPLRVPHHLWEYYGSEGLP
jgi:hydroxymethylpyrimidine/phosphomethylpyrimidine kinase